MCNFTQDGTFVKGDENCFDLFFAPTKHEGWANIYMVSCGDSFCEETGTIFKTKEEALNNAEGVSYIGTAHIEWEE